VTQSVLMDGNFRIRLSFEILRRDQWPCMCRLPARKRWISIGNDAAPEPSSNTPSTERSVIFDRGLKVAARIWQGNCLLGIQSTS